MASDLGVESLWLETVNPDLGQKVRMRVFFGYNIRLTWDLILEYVLYGLRDALNLCIFHISCSTITNLF